MTTTMSLKLKETLPSIYWIYIPLSLCISLCDGSFYALMLMLIDMQKTVALFSTILKGLHGTCSSGPLLQAMALMSMCPSGSFYAFPTKFLRSNAAAPEQVMLNPKGDLQLLCVSLPQGKPQQPQWVNLDCSINIAGTSLS